MKIRTVEVSMDAADLLSCVWYSDGSGHSGIAGIPLEGPHEDYRVHSVDMAKGVVVFQLYAKDND